MQNSASNKEEKPKAGSTVQYDDLSEPVPEDENGFLGESAWQTVNESLGTGSKRVILVTKPVTLNEIHRLATRR